MTEPWKSYEVEIETLSPIAICTGEKIPLVSSYVVEGNKAYRIDFDRFIDEEVEPGMYLFKEIMRIIEKKDVYIGDIFEKYKIEKEKYISYSLKNGIPEHYFSRTKNPGKRPVSRDVQTFVKHSTSLKKFKAYIPGSSVKGAIVTAIMWKFPESCSENRTSPKAQYFKRIAIQDSDEIDCEKLILAEVNRINFFKKREGPPVAIEALSEETKIETKIKIYGENSNRKFVDEKERREPFKKDINEIFKICNERSEHMVNAERKFIENSKKIMVKNPKIGLPEEDLKEFYDKITNLLENIDREKECLLRIGFGSSFRSTSLDWARLYDGLKNKKRVNEKALSYFKEPYTRWLVNLEERYLPLGWAKLKIKE